MGQIAGEIVGQGRRKDVTAMNRMTIEPGHEVVLKTRAGVPEQVHVFDKAGIDAVNTALAARRPLLVRGEPGVGKSQLARAAAKQLGRAYVQFVVDSRTEANDVMWRFDPVARLAEAQICSHVQESPAETRKRLEVLRYVHPAAMWWAFDWNDALAQAGRVSRAGMSERSEDEEDCGSVSCAPPQDDGGDPEKGCVVLIDEIDKAETDVPNGLLEAFGACRFVPLGRVEPVVMGDTPPLVVITTNEERALPDAFVRRCMVLHLRLPADRDELKELLVQRGAAHFKQADETVLREVARQLIEDRERERSRQLPPPGQAEYLDMVRAVIELEPDDTENQIQALKYVGTFALGKHEQEK